jgi:hypothetical protein
MLEEPATNGAGQHRRIGLTLRALRFEWGKAGINGAGRRGGRPAFRRHPGNAHRQACSNFKQAIVEPSLRANGSRECAPDDRLHEAIHRAAQRKNGLLRRFRLRSLSYGGQVAPRNDLTEMLMSPLPLWESIGRLRRPFSEKDAEAKLRLCRIDRCDPGEGLRSIDRP